MLTSMQKLLSMYRSHGTGKSIGVFFTSKFVVPESPEIEEIRNEEDREMLLFLINQWLSDNDFKTSLPPVREKNE